MASKTEIAEFLGPLALQFPNGLSLSSARSPIRAILSPVFFSGRIFSSFLSSTIASFAMSSEIFLFWAFRIFLFSLSSLQYLKGSLKSPKSYFK